MLRAKDRSVERSLSWPARVGLVALLAAVALGVSALRGPGQKLLASPPDEGHVSQVSARRATHYFDSWPEASNRAPFDLSYLPPEAMGAFGFRPAAVFGRPALKKHVERFNQLFAENFKLLGLKAKFGLRLEDIEQVTGSIRIVTTTPHPKGPKNGAQSALLTDPFLIRTSHDFDWKTKLRAALPKLKEQRHAGRSYYQASKGVVPMLGPELCFFVPDRRTLILGSEKSVQAMLAGQRGDSSAWDADWKQVERGLFAVALDNRAKKWLHERRQPEEVMEADEVALFEHADTFVLGVADVSGAVVQAFAQSSSDETAIAVATAINDLLKRGRQALDKAAREHPPEAATAVRAQRLARDLLRHCKVQRDGKTVTVRSHSYGSIDDALEAWFAEIPPVSVEIKATRKPADASGP
jgi:hypothetical protein